MIMSLVEAYLVGELIISVDSDAFSLYKKSHFGEPKENKMQYSLPEALFLVEKGKMDIFFKNKKLSQKEFNEKCRKIDRKIQIKYPVFKDLRERGYVVKTALKFGADFRVYEKGSSPGDKHAKWVVFTEHESNRLTWHEFSAKNRVAHSTKKNLLLAIADEEGDISYYEVRWLKP
jgi:tRNA-intron endonuclease, archaea type